MRMISMIEKRLSRIEKWMERTSAMLNGKPARRRRRKAKRRKAKTVESKPAPKKKAKKRKPAPAKSE